MSKILLTGCAGFIGSHLSENLIEGNHELIGIDAFLNDSYPSKLKSANWNYVKKLSTTMFYNEDIRSFDFEKLPKDIEYIIHCAAMPGLPKSWTNFELYEQHNLVATFKLVEFALKLKGLKSFTLISTSSVYGKNAIGDESSILEPYSPYGVTKLAAEQLLRAFHSNFNLPYNIVRLFSVYGPRQRPDMVYNIIIDKLLRDEEISIYGDGTQARTNTYVLDVVKAIVATIESNMTGLTLNIAGTESIELNSAINLISELMQKDAKLKYLDARPGDQTVTKGDISLARELIGFLPSTTFSDGIFEQISFQKANFLKN